jgi:hypothetical protein
VGNSREFRVDRTGRAQDVSDGWPGLDRREAPECRPQAEFRYFAHIGSNPGHSNLFARLKNAKALVVVTTSLRPVEIAAGESPLPIPLK